jgi:uncharacterized protein (TIGR00251 family)
MKSSPKANPARSPAKLGGVMARARVAVKVQPGASADRLAGKTVGEWKISLTAPAVEGRANAACIKFLAKLLGVPPSSIVIARGAGSRHKIIDIDGLQQQELERKLEHAAAP